MPLRFPLSLRTHATVRDWGNISNTVNFDTDGRYGADSAVAAKTDTTYVNIDTIETMFAFGDFEGLLSSNLSGVCSAFLTTAEAVSAGRASCECTTGLVGNGNDSIVEGSLDVYLTRSSQPACLFCL